MNYLALARKWRPKTFSDVSGQDPTVTSISNAITNSRLHHAYLFSGSHGIGKTSLARLLAKSLSCEQGPILNPCGVCQSCRQIDKGAFVDLIEVDAASRTKVEDTRELLDNVQYAPVVSRYKIYLIDEAHMLSNHSFNALLKTLEEPPEHVKFLLATTEPQKLPATIVSRCVHFALNKISRDSLVNKLTEILTAEGVGATDEALQLLATQADGSLRDALSLLDKAITYSSDKIVASDIAKILGLPEPELIAQLLFAIYSAKADEAFVVAKNLFATGATASGIIKALQTELYRLSLAQFIPSTETSSKLALNLKEITSEVLQLYYEIVSLAQKNLPYAPSPQVAIDMLIMRMLSFQPLEQLDNAQPPSKISSPTLKVDEPIKVTEAKKVKVDKSFSHIEPVVNTSSVQPKWGQLLAQLPLRGLVKIIAENCTLESWEGTSLVLTLDKLHKPLLNSKNVAKLQQLLREHLNQPINLKIIPGENKEATPAKIDMAEKGQIKAQATSQMESDPLLTSLQAELKAKIVSVCPIDN